MIHRARWALPIDRPPLAGGWVESENGRIVRIGDGKPPGPADDLGDVAILPGLVNAHTHLELAWMAGRVPPSPSMDAWIGALLSSRRAGPSGGEAEVLEAMARAAVTMHATGTVLVGDISNTLLSPRVLAAAGLGGVVFHELLGFNTADPNRQVKEAWARVAVTAHHLQNPQHPKNLQHPQELRFSVVAHAPYSVSPSLFIAIANRAGDTPLTVHLGESAEEIEFLETGGGPIRRTLEALGVWVETWEPPACDPVRYMENLGYLQPGTLVVHGVHLTDDALERLWKAQAVLVACPRSNLWVGAGAPRLAHFYSSRAPVAIGTDSLASAPTLNMFDELAEMRRLAPEVAAATLLDSATRRGAVALGFGDDYGTLAPRKRAALVAVEVPGSVGDVEEYLVSGIAPETIRRVA